MPGAAGRFNLSMGVRGIEENERQRQKAKRFDVVNQSG